MFCWKTLEANKVYHWIADVRAWALVVLSTVVVTYVVFLVILQRFRVYLLETNRVLDFVVILLYFSLEHKLDPSKKRICHSGFVTLRVLTKHLGFFAYSPPN